MCIRDRALAVRAQREEVVIGVRRIDGGLDRAEAGVADGARRQTGIDIGVVWAVDLLSLIHILDDAGDVGPAVGIAVDEAVPPGVRCV